MRLKRENSSLGQVGLNPVGVVGVAYGLPVVLIKVSSGRLRVVGSKKTMTVGVQCISYGPLDG